MAQFTHLHCHTQYSLLDGASKIKPFLAQTKKLGMQAVAITDHGNMFGVPHFVNAAHQIGIKPIIGCEFYLAKDRHDRKDKKRYHQLLLAKNKVGYQNIIRLCSLGFTEGYYYKPRIDKALLHQYHEGLIATTCCLGAEIPTLIREKGEAEAEKCFLEWWQLFGDDYYIELQRCGLAEQEHCNQILLKWHHKYGVKVIATNDVHYTHEGDSKAHDILLCLQTGKDINDPNRFRFSSNQFFLKSPQQMATLFADIPQALETTLEITEKINTPSLQRDVLMPIFQLPQSFTSQAAYLKHLALEGANKRCSQLNDAYLQRLNYELKVIEKMGFEGYFLIVQDFITAAHKLNVMVGPGRGSVAGSLVAYALGITDIDPIKYNILFERFLNPERITMPDIDVDFDDEGRQKVIDYVVNKYGHNQVAQIITFGTMGAKSAIRDVARVMKLPLAQADYMAKLIPDRPGTTLAQAFQNVPELQNLYQQKDTPEGQVLAMATTLEGVTRHAGIHAAGLIIAPDDLRNHIPVKMDKNTGLLVSQYDGSVIEQVGGLKMDFLGLKTLSIIKDTIALIAQTHGQQINLKSIPYDDPKTFALYQKGNTIATFQFESAGMREWLKKLKPTTLEDLIAMNALYRPGPMRHIPDFIARKHGKQTITYPHPLLAEILKPTYGIMVYQEQIMQAAQIMAGYSLGAADLLRRAMGKKKVEVMAKQQAIFVKGAYEKHELSEKKALAIFDIMAAFAQYGFPRAHAVAYGRIAYQTSYLKANYPAQYMAAVLKHNRNDLSKITEFIAACKKMGLCLLGPDVNSSHVHFSVDTQKKIRFGLSAIKGVGEGAATAIVSERTNNGVYKDIFQLIERNPKQQINKKTLEALALAGAFDTTSPYHRKQYVYATDGAKSFLERVVAYGRQYHKTQTVPQASLFASDVLTQYNAKPEAPSCSPYAPLEQLKLEKDLIGFYISGHPLDNFKADIHAFCNANTQNVYTKTGQTIRLAGMISQCAIRQTKAGHPFGTFTLEDYHGTLALALFGSSFRKNQHFLHEGEFIYLIGDVVQRYNQSDRLDLRINKLALLTEMRNKLTQSLQLYIQVDNFSAADANRLIACLKAHRGHTKLEIVFHTKKQHLKVTTEAQAHKIKASNELFAALTAFPKIKYRLVGLQS